MAAPYQRDVCTVCRQRTRHWLLRIEAEFSTICGFCLALVIEREDGSVVQWAASDEEPDAVPPPIDMKRHGP
jgi:hypothetical protein